MKAIVSHGNSFDVLPFTKEANIPKMYRHFSELVENLHSKFS